MPTIKMRKSAAVILVLTSIVLGTVLHRSTLVDALDEDDFVRDGEGVPGYPEIEYGDETIVLQKGAVWNVTCKSNQPIMWTHYASTHIWFPPNVIIPDENIPTGDPEKPYGKMLILTDASAAMVGRYYCVDEASYTEEREEELDEMVTEYLASAVYVYVNDPDQPLVPVETPIFRVNQYEDFVIPCKPTHPAIEVELFKDLHGELIETNKFSNTQGYELSFNRLEDGGSYYCQVKDNPDHRIHFEITVDEHCEFSVVERHRRYIANGSTVDTDALDEVVAISNDTKCNSTACESTTVAYEYGEQDTGNATVAGASPTYERTTENRPTTPLYFHVYSRDVRSSTLPLTVSPVSEYLMKPSIESDTKDHVPLGQRIRLLCKINIRAGVQLDMTWLIPPTLTVAKNNGRIKVGNMKVVPIEGAEHREYASRELIIDKATLQDNGTYRCEVKDMNKHKNYHSFRLHVRESTADYVMLSEENDLQNIKVSRKANGATPPIDIVFEYRSFPTSITYYWMNESGVEITAVHSGKYELSHTATHVKLRINDPSVYDTGNYTVFVMAGNAEQSKRMGVYVHAAPIVDMESKFVKSGEQVSFLCRSIGYPRPEISFMFLPCSDRPWRNCSIQATPSSDWDSSSSDIDSEPSARRAPGGKRETQIAVSRVLRHTATVPGVVYCRATNDEGSATTQADLLISDLPDAITLEIEHPKETITVGDRVTIVCSALVYNFTNEITFTNENGDYLQQFEDVPATYSRTLYAWQTRYNIESVQHEHQGRIFCRAKSIYNTSESRALDLEVLDPVAPKLVSGSNNETLSVELTSALQLECNIVGTPDPKIEWLKDGVPMELEEGSNRMQLTKTALVFTYLLEKDFGKYICRAENKMGKIEKHWNVDLRTAVVSKSLIYAIIALLLLLIVAIVLVSLFYCKKKKEVKAMKEAGIVNFEEGNLGIYNPDLALDEQADLLPYNSEYEFPKERLKLGKQLGTGAFGVVMKATATRIMVNEDETTVAVKMVKKQTDNEVMRALVSELKIMVHLGQHLNVVNLLGAVTKNIAKRELMVIVEYCRFGNVQNFLLKHRPYFIDQINQETGEIDSSIDKNQLRWSNCGYQYNSGSSQYVDPKKHLNSKGYVRHSGMQNMGMVDSCNTEVTAMTSVEVEDLNTVNSNEPLWRSNYGMDYKGPARSVNTTDLVCWASQIACGMEYLASRKVLHGDLAARNILLCDDNVVKICDFGLARSMYKSDNYKKKGEAPLPFKWLALECISDNVFSTYSDVWAYGIVLWELFSLGKVPYPGMEANQELYNKLRDGYRMDKPQYSNQDIYDIMLNCWNVKPDSRPSFKDLKSRFNAMLPDELRDHYLELNEPYLQMNAEKVERGETDYLVNLGPPEEPAPAAPNYVNGIILPLPPKIRSDKDYLKMSRTKSESEESHFDFASFNSERHSPTIRNNLDTSPPNGSKRHKKRGLPEEIPMLDGSRLSSTANGFHSDSETETVSPMPRERTSKHNQSEPEYMNVKGQKFTGRSPNDEPIGAGTQEAISNPGYIALNVVDEKRF
uniref:Vascular endothelial growth factor receptor 1 n=1 Tax=Anopheles farauti TaxID=69004 RepID=A0A182Q009_9DIPT